MKKEIVYLMLMFLLAAGSAGAFLLLLPFLTKGVHFSLTQAGIIGGAFSFSRIFAVVPLTALAAKTGSIPLLLIATAVYGLGFLIVGFSNAFLAFVLLFLIIGIAISIFQPLVFGLATRWTEPENRGKVMGFITSGSDLGRIGIAGTISFLATQIGWHLASLIAGIAVLFFLVFAYMRRPHLVEEKIMRETHFWKDAKVLSKNILYILTGVLVFFDTIASSTLFIYLPFLMLYRHMSISLLPILITVFFMGSLVGKLYLGRLTDKFQNTIVFIICEGFMGLCLVVIANVTSPLFFTCFSFILGVLTKGTVPASLTMASESVKDTGNFENAFAFNYVILAIANTITPIIVGFIADHANISVSFYFCATAAFLATIPAFLFHKKRDQKHLEETIAVEKVIS